MSAKVDQPSGVLTPTLLKSIDQNNSAALQRVLKDNEEELLWVAEVMAGSRGAGEQCLGEAIELAEAAQYVGREWVLSLVKRLLVYAVLMRISGEIPEFLVRRRTPIPVTSARAGLSASERQQLRSISPARIIAECDLLERSCLILFAYLQYSVLDCALLLACPRALVGSICQRALTKAVDLISTAPNALGAVDPFNSRGGHGMRWLSVLSIGPAQFSDLVRDALLLHPHSRLTVAASYWDLCSVSLHQKSHLHVAVLMDAGPAHQLRRCAEYIRRRWPDAAILLVGNSPEVLEDELYDERERSRIGPERLLTVIDRLDQGSVRFKQDEAEDGVEVGIGPHDR